MVNMWKSKTKQNPKKLNLKAKEIICVKDQNKSNLCHSKPKQSDCINQRKAKKRGREMDSNLDFLPAGSLLIVSQLQAKGLF